MDAIQQQEMALNRLNHLLPEQRKGEAAVARFKEGLAMGQPNKNGPHRCEPFYNLVGDRGVEPRTNGLRVSINY